MTMPRFSVILPVFNGSRYVRESIASVLAQQFRDFELLICDDGSSDETPQIIEGYRDPRVRVLRNATNRGLFPTLNRLVDESRTDLIRLWSQDDRMKPDCLTAEWAFWRRHPHIGLCYSAFDRIDARGRCIRPAPIDPTPEIVPPWLAAQISFYHGCMTGNIATTSFPKVVHRDVGRFREDQEVSGDFEFFVRVCQRYLIGRQRRSVIEVRDHDRQFSRAQHAQLVNMRENEPIFDELARRLPPQLAGHARRYRLRYQYVKRFHHAVRAILARDLRSSVSILRFLAEVTNPLVVAICWLLSANAHFARPTTVYQSPYARRYYRIVHDMGDE